MSLRKKVRENPNEKSLSFDLRKTKGSRLCDATFNLC